MPQETRPALRLVGDQPAITGEESSKQEVVAALQHAIETAEKPSLKDFVIPTITVEMIGPKEAMELYRMSRGNRPTRLNHVLWLTRQILDDKFRCGPPIMVDTRGVLISGHHRLEAIMRAGKYVPMVIERGVDPALREYSNQHKAETLGNELKVAGVSNYNSAAAAARLAVLLTSEKRIPIQTVSDFKEWKKVFKGLDPVLKCLTKGGDPWRQASIVGAFVYAYNTNPDVVMRCAVNLSTGAALAEKDPILKFRNWYISHKKKKAEHGIAGGGDERIRVFTWRTLHAIRSVIERTRPRDFRREVNPSILDEDMAFFRRANLTNKAIRLQAYWTGPKISSDDFIGIVKEDLTLG